MANPCLTGTTDTMLTIVGVDGVRHEFTDCAAPYSLGQGGTIRGVAPTVIQSRPRGVGIPGEVVSLKRAGPRDIAVPFIVRGDTEIELETNIGALGSYLSAVEGVCDLIWRRADGTSRAITVTHVAGGDTIRVNNLATDRHAVFTATFRAHEQPYWRSIDNVEGVAAGAFSDAFTALSDPLDLINDGDVRTWPRIRVTGECEAIEFLSITTGSLFRVIEVLGAGQRVDIDTDPTRRTVFLDDVWQPSVMDPQAANMFALLPGVNKVVLRAHNQTGTGTFSIRWPNRFETC